MNVAAAPTTTSLVFDDEANATDDEAARLLLVDKFLSRKAALILEGSTKCMDRSDDGVKRKYE